MRKMILLALLVAGQSIAFAQKPGVVLSDKTGWHKIGETSVDFKSDSDAIAVLVADRFEFVRIVVEDAPIHLVSFRVHFESGDSQDVAIGKELKAPGETRVVKLNGGERSIKRVAFVYHTVPNYADKKARVQLWGMKTNPDKTDKKKDPDNRKDQRDDQTPQ